MKSLIYDFYGRDIFSPLHGYPTKIRRSIRNAKLYPILYFRYKRNKILYGEAAPNPFKLIYVNPDEIEKVTKRKVLSHKTRFEDMGKIKPGNWDRISEEKFKDMHEEIGKLYFYYYYCKGADFSDTRFFNAMKKHFELDKDWEETSYYEYANEHSGKDLDNVDQIFKNIKEGGYRERNIESNRLINKLDEITVDIDRDGNFLLVDSRHRLSISKILELEYIPVRIVCRHKKWQKIRVLASEDFNSLPENLKNHPDLKEFKNVGD